MCVCRTMNGCHLSAILDGFQVTSLGAKLCRYIGIICIHYFSFFFFNDPATPEIYPLPLPAALPIPPDDRRDMLASIGASSTDELFASIPPEFRLDRPLAVPEALSEIELTRHLQHLAAQNRSASSARSEEHTSELQSQSNLVCRLLLE